MLHVIPRKCKFAAIAGHKSDSRSAASPVRHQPCDWTARTDRHEAHRSARVREQCCRHCILWYARLDAANEEPVHENADLPGRRRRRLINEVLAAAQGVLDVKHVRGARHRGVAPPIACAKAVHGVHVPQFECVVDVRGLHLGALAMVREFDALLEWWACESAAQGTMARTGRVKVLAS